MIGLIVGTGFSELEMIASVREGSATTRYGEASAPLIHTALGGAEVLLLARHGTAHTIPPHRINYRANLWALHEAGVAVVVGVNAVGAIRAGLEPGQLVVPDQIIDYTHGRSHSFFEDSGDPVVHADFAYPYSASLRRALLAGGCGAGMSIHEGGTHGVVQGPRLETVAEVDRLERDGCDIVGMTGMPEAVLARELGIDYAACTIVSNLAAGRGEDIHGEIAKHMRNGTRAALRLLEAALPGLSAGA